MSSRTKNWNLKPGDPSFMPKAEKEQRRRIRQYKMERRAKYGYTAQNVYTGRLR